MKRVAICPICKNRYPVRPLPTDTSQQDVFPRHACFTNGGWCEGSRWIVEEEDYVRAPA